MAGKIIVAENDEFSRNLVKIIFERKGFEVIARSDGRELLDKVKELGGKVDGVVSDYDMPNVNGIEAAEIIRHKWGYGFPFYLMTGREIETVKEQGDLAGITGYVQKPDYFKELESIADSLQPSHEDSQSDPEQQ